ncbi:MAG: hypothetical protein ABWZ40_13465 [Caulobacterales bacterium]
MGQKPALILLLAPTLALAGCANLGGYVAKQEQTPQWFKSRVKEVEGEGYPKFSQANLTPRPRKTPEEWAEVRADIASAKSEVDADPRTINPGPLRNSMELQAAAKKKVKTVGVEQ